MRLQFVLLEVVLLIVMSFLVVLVIMKEALTLCLLHMNILVLSRGLFLPKELPKQVTNVMAGGLMTVLPKESQH